MTTEVNAAAPAPSPAPAPAPTPPLEISTAVPGEVAAPPAPAPAPAPAAAPEAVVYNPTGDVGLDMTLKFVGDLGYSPEHPAMAAAINGNFALLEAELASKGVKGYEAYIKLGQQAYTAVSAKTAERQAQDKAAIEKIAGSSENWAAMTAWAATNADPTEKTVLQSQLAKGGLEAQMAAQWLAHHYSKVNAPVTEGAGPVVADTRGAGQSSGALSPKEYGAAVAQARAVHRSGVFEESDAYRQLVARRSAYRG